MEKHQRYPVLKEDTRIHLNPYKSVLACPTVKMSETTSTYKDELEMNKTSAEIILMCDGTKTDKEIVHDLCERYGEDPHNHKEWIEDFFESLVKYDVLEFLPLPQKRPINVTGSFEFPTPLHAVIELLAQCNLKCAHCYRGSAPEVKDIMPYEKAIELLDLLRAKGVIGIELTGGEITIYPNFKKIFCKAVEMFNTVGLLTNGTMINDELAELFGQYKDKLIISISLDGPNGEIHDKFRGVKGAFNRTCQGIRKLAAQGIMVRVAMSVFEENKWMVEDTILLAKELGAKLFSYSYVESFGRGSQVVFTPKSEDAEKIYEYERSIHEKYAGFVAVLTEDQMARNNQEKNCGAGWRSITINPFGDVRPCAMFPQKLMDLGNLFNQDYDEVFSSSMAKSLFAVHSPVKSDKCPSTCKSRLYCKGCVLRAIESNSRNKIGVCTWIRHNELTIAVNQMREEKMLNLS